MEIIPAILPAHFAELEQKVAQVRAASIAELTTIQIDICDGKYTPNATWPYRKADQSFEAILREERGLPGWEDFDFEIDLMAHEPEKLLGDWLTAGASRVIIHLDALAADTAAAMAELGRIIGTCRGLVEIGIAVGVETVAERVAAVAAQYREDISVVQCMGIAHAGFQCQPFDERVLARIAEVKALFPGVPVSVDGGVNLETVGRLAEVGVTRAVAGSAVFEMGSVRENIEALGGF
ncbi:MAG: hypothetical protein AAB391_04090 [Patescibacteria group bacterium]